MVHYNSLINMETDKLPAETKPSVQESPPKPKVGTGLKRTITGLSMLAGFGLVVYGGVPCITLTGFFIQFKCFQEIIKIAYQIKKIPDVPFFRTINWYFVITANYILFGELLAKYTQVFIKKYYLLQVLARYHRFMSFIWYFIGIIWFLTMLKKKLIRQQFSLLFWTHFLVMIVSVQLYMTYQNMYEGLIWLIIPLWLVILNDVFAYVFGKFFGKTPLISLSPNKTLEGFVLGGLSTFILGSILAWIFCHFQYLVCPIKYIEVEDNIVASTNCTRSYLFEPSPYYIGNTGLSINYYPFIQHSLFMSVFASIIAPFGGFAASGFKRANKVKDFGDLIPGHGGIMDRFDCQFLMMTFVNVYISTFIKTPDVDLVFQQILNLNENAQLEFYKLLKDSLHERLLDR
ncbi:phosphatidate cytidylyltransferase, photoreceptor-specific isoform X1 [Diabrotica virgifera virgifera]|uniref:Phosphatidate cytidylyltransferase n=2 Tax=Diabrotica virgifera virgifera TaxID=50390 RepID=A0A6P7H9A0_DIAVI|nr:phosphatidate cytidylyltransferase, photoreceptor-specific isoform X1 [Diabrotica virgifera virgifera]